MVRIDLSDGNAGLLLTHVKSQLHDINSLTDKPGAVLAFESLMVALQAQLINVGVTDPFEELNKKNEAAALDALARELKR